MSTIDELMFSNDICAAFLAAIVASHERQHPRSSLGRTAMQKLSYFSKVLGVPLPCSFGMYTYGPYSDAVAFAIDSLLVDDVICDTSPNPKYSNYRSGPNLQMLLSQFDSDLSAYVGTVDRVVGALGSFPPNGLELLATLHFVAERQKRIAGGRITRTLVVEEFKSIKKDKFSDEQISTWYEALVRAGLI